MKNQPTEVEIAALEDKIDAAEGLAVQSNTKGTLSLEAYLKSQKDG